MERFGTLWSGRVCSRHVVAKPEQCQGGRAFDAHEPEGQGRWLLAFSDGGRTQCPHSTRSWSSGPPLARHCHPLKHGTWTGILNKTYTGRLIFNRRKFSKNPDTEQREARMNEESE